MSMYFELLATLCRAPTKSPLRLEYSRPTQFLPVVTCMLRGMLGEYDWIQSNRVMILVNQNVSIGGSFVLNSIMFKLAYGGLQLPNFCLHLNNDPLYRVVIVNQFQVISMSGRNTK